MATALSCPIGQCLIPDPVMTEEGITFGKGGLELHCATQRRKLLDPTCPVTRNRLDVTTLRPNRMCFAATEALVAAVTNKEANETVPTAKAEWAGLRDECAAWTAKTKQTSALDEMTSPATPRADLYMTNSPLLASSTRSLNVGAAIPVSPLGASWSLHTSYSSASGQRQRLH